MLYEMKDKREWSGDEHTIGELRVICEEVQQYYEESIVIHGLGDNYVVEGLEDRLLDVCFNGIVGDFRFLPNDWGILESIEGLQV